MIRSILPLVVGVVVSITFTASGQLTKVSCFGINFEGQCDLHMNLGAVDQVTCSRAWRCDIWITCGHHVAGR